MNRAKLKKMTRPLPSRTDLSDAVYSMHRRRYPGENGVRYRFPAPGSSSADTVSFRFLLSELLWDASLLQYRIGRVAGQNLVVDGKAALRDGALPDFVIPATGAFKSAP